MNLPSNVSVSTGESMLEGDPRWQLVLRIARSPQFAKAARLRCFLMYVCQAALEGRHGDISEQKVGARVFERSPEYNPNDDNIVRSHARLLRQKLEAYFSADGINEPLLLRIPKGGYLPEFVDRVADPVLEATAEPPVEQPSPAEALPESAPNTQLIAILACAVVILTAAVGILTVMLLHSRPVPEGPALASLWSRLFNDKMATTILIPDSTYSMLQEASGEREHVAEYMEHRLAPSEKLRAFDTLLPSFPTRRYTTYDAVSTTARILQIADRFHGKLGVRFARDATLKDISPGNLILIGRPVNNPWVELFESKLNFTLQTDFENHIVVAHNRSPLPGELPAYRPEQEGSGRILYSSVAFLENRNHGGNVLIIGGVTSGSEESAAELVTNEKLFEEFVGKLNPQGGTLPHFDVLLRSSTIGGASQEPDIVGFRTLETH